MKQTLQQPIRRSARLRNKDIHTKHPLPSLSMSPPKPQITTTTQKQRRLQEAETHSDNLTEKQTQTSRRTSCNVENKESPRDTTSSKKIEHWIWEGRWPKEYFEPTADMDLPLKKRKRTSSPPEDSAANTYFTGGDATRAAASPGYREQLRCAGILLDGDVGTISIDCIKLCNLLLTKEQPVPQVSLFQDDIFPATTNGYWDRNEAIVFRDITPLIVPSAELFYRFGSTHLQHIREDLNTHWTRCIRLANVPYPKPDYAIGLKASIFTQDEYNRLMPYIGGGGTCYFKVTDAIFFPFLICETKCGRVGLTVADQQNAHSASIAVNAIVQLYKAIKRQGDINRKILAFSISHDDRTVRIYGHYPVIDGDKTEFYRYTILEFCLTNKEKWNAYKFTRNIYDEFLPAHAKRIKSAIMQLPDPKELAESLTSKVDIENNPKSHEMHPPSQDTGSLKQEQLAEAMQQENNRLRDQVNQFMQQLAHRDEQFELQRRGMKQEYDELKVQLVQQLAHQGEQFELQRRGMKQENDELKDQVNQLMGQINLWLKPGTAH